MISIIERNYEECKLTLSLGNRYYTYILPEPSLIDIIPQRHQYPSKSGLVKYKHSIFTELKPYLKEKGTLING